jgi:hypothetical protein
LIWDALLRRRGSPRAALDRAGGLVASRQAYYGKLRRFPLSLSLAYLRHTAAALRPSGAAPPGTLPACLDRLEVRMIDGKSLKRVAKRLAPARGAAGRLLGGKLLVSWDPRAGLVDALAADPDGEANECRLVPALLEQWPAATAARPRLVVADRQFGDKAQPGRLRADGRHFLFRRNRKTRFHPDPQRPEHAARHEAVGAGRAVTRQWGWLGQGRGRLYVRQITLARPGEEDLVLVTDLTDAGAYPAAALLEVYRRRWGIEQVFGQITEVFGLARFIGSSPEATVFQAAYCLMLYNLIGVVKGYVAGAGGVAASEVSPGKLFEAVHEELASLSRLVPPRGRGSAAGEPPDGGSAAGAAPGIAGRELEGALPEGEGRPTAPQAEPSPASGGAHLRIPPATEASPSQRQPRLNVDRAGLTPPARR